MTKYKLAVDTGSTFTDLCLLPEDGSQVMIAKVPSTPENPARAIEDGLEKLASLYGADRNLIHLILHGTTIATNTLLEDRGARTALLVTKGFRDLLLIRRQNRPHLYDFWATWPDPLIPRHLTWEVDERVMADGSIHQPLDREKLQQTINDLKSAAVESVAVCLLHAYINPGHEQEVGRMIKKALPEVQVTLSAELLPACGEYERTSTTAINAIVQPRMKEYLNEIEKHLGTGSTTLFIMQSNGGVLTARQARAHSAGTVLSGPAGGVLAGVYLAQTTGHRNLITADMGGTSMDVAVIHQGLPRYTADGKVSGYPLRLPMLDVNIIGAGGSSIAWVDSGGALRVGPGSAGAKPGPACYGQGGIEPTVTDANVILGRLQPAFCFSEAVSIAPELAHRAIADKVAKPLGLDVMQAAEGIIKVVNANMVRAMQAVLLQRGHDPRNFTMLACGGAGPLHAVELARELNIPRIIIPRYPGVNSAFGMLSAVVKRDYIQAFQHQLNPASLAQLNGIMQNLADRGRAELAAEGFPVAEVNVSRSADLRYQGQAYELTVPLPGGPLGSGDLVTLKQVFHRTHLKEYGYSRNETVVELVTLRAVITGKLPGLPVERPPAKQITAQKSPAVPVIFDSQTLRTPVLPRTALGPGVSIDGPAIIHQADTTIILWSDSRAVGDAWGNLLIKVGEHQ